MPRYARAGEAGHGMPWLGKGAPWPHQRAGRGHGRLEDPDRQMVAYHVIRHRFSREGVWGHVARGIRM